MSSAVGTLAAPARITIADHQHFTAAVLATCGVGFSDAEVVAQALATTDSWGTFTHGLKCLPGYVHRLRHGGLRGDAVPQVVGQGPAWAVLRGGSGLGAVAGVTAMRRAISLARGAGVAYVGVADTCHFGAAGYYATLAAEAGMVGIAMANDAPSMTVPGARGRIIGNNPLAIAVPCGERIIMLDMALSAAAGGKIVAAHQRGERIPSEWSVDVDGQPTTDPAAFLAGGALLPSGGHKGFGLAVMVEMFSAVLTGAACLGQVRSWVLDDPSIATGHGAAFLALDIGAIAGCAAFAARMAAFAAVIHASPRAGEQPVCLPGEREWETRQRALREGIVLPGDVVAAARELGVRTQVPLEPLLTPVP